MIYWIQMDSYYPLMSLPVRTKLLFQEKEMTESVKQFGPGIIGEFVIHL